MEKQNKQSNKNGTADAKHDVVRLLYAVYADSRRMELSDENKMQAVFRNKNQAEFFGNKFYGDFYEIKIINNNKYLEKMEKNIMKELNRKELISLWGEELFRLLGHHFDEFGFIREDWQEIIEDETPRFDKNYNDNPDYSEAYQLMYNLDFEEVEGRLRPIS